MGFVNKILEKNLFYIKKYDLELCKKLEAIESLSSDIQMIYTDLNEPNLAVNGVPVSAQSGAQAEAEAKVKGFSHNNTSSIHIVFGTGFGYIFKQVVEFSRGTVILYEPNLELLRVMLEMVDLSDILSQSRVFVANDLCALERHFSACFVVGTQTALTFTSYHKTCLKSDFDALIKKLRVLQGMLEINEKQRVNMGGIYAAAVVKNLPLALKCNCVNVLKDSLKGIPAVIAAAGPSLGDNLDFIKKYRKKFVLFSVSTSYKALVENGINPDFVSMIERFDASNFVQDYSPENVCLIAEPYVNSSVLRQNFRNKFITYSVENSANKIYEKAFNIEHEYFETKGTVAYNALFAAKMAGCNPIILVGQDLAYVDGECYSKNSPLADYKCRKTSSGWQVYVEEFDRLKKNLYGHRKDWSDAEINTLINNRINELNNQLVSVKSLSGQEIATSQVFALFAEYYKQFSREYGADVKLYTVSNKGADIGGFEYMQFEEIFSARKDINRDVLETIFKIKKIPEFNFKLIETEMQLLKQSNLEIQELKQKFTEFGQAVDAKIIDEKVLLLLKSLLSAYASIQKKYSTKSIIYSQVTFASKAAMAKVMANETNVSAGGLRSIYSALKEFFDKDSGRIVYIISILAMAIRGIESEIGCSKG